MRHVAASAVPVVDHTWRDQSGGKADWLSGSLRDKRGLVVRRRNFSSMFREWGSGNRDKGLFAGMSGRGETGSGWVWTGPGPGQEQ